MFVSLHQLVLLFNLAPTMALNYFRQLMADSWGRKGESESDVMLSRTYSFPFILFLQNILFMLPEWNRLESTQLKTPLRGKDTPAFLKLHMALVKQKHKHIIVRNRLVSLYLLANEGMVWNAIKTITIQFIKCVFTPFVYYTQPIGDVLSSSKRDISCSYWLKSFILLCAASGSELWAHL